MPVPLFQIDAFADAAFEGNPAAVCLLASPADPAWMQHVAAEMNLSETAFLVRRPVAAGSSPSFDLRWFTPSVEVDLCGHATLASAHALWQSASCRRTSPRGSIRGAASSRPSGARTGSS